MSSLLLSNRLRILTLVAVILGVAGGCGLRRPPVPVDRSQDERIHTEVVARILAEPALDAESIRVEVDGGMVILYGAVEGLGEWQCAITNAALVDGVESVVAYLVIERGDREVTCLSPRPETSTIVGGS